MRIQAIASAVSKGTENLVYHGRVPKSEWTRMRAPLQIGDFSFPVKYGYAMVGQIILGNPDQVGKKVFTLHPHEEIFDVPEDMVAYLPDDLSPVRAVLCANMETAINAVWDGEPTIGDRVSIIGAGVVGSLIAFIVNKIPGTKVTLIDKNPNRNCVAKNLGVGYSLPKEADTNQDIIFQASGNPEGLETAINLAGLEARIIDVSWYGDKTASLQLGGAFHSQRLRIISSQVGKINVKRLVRWNNRQRLDLAISLLEDPILDTLLENRYQFGGLPEQFPKILDPENDVVCPVILY